MTEPTEIANIAANWVFFSRLVTNVYRGLIVEAIVSVALGTDWEWCSEDWYACDFRHRESKTHLEVKQSAACQSWQTKRPSVASWDIGARKYVWQNEEWTSKPGRNAEIYVLAWHPETDRIIADHRDPWQWEFFVIPADALPPNKRMGMTAARKLAHPGRFDELGRAVGDALAKLTPRSAAP